MQRIETTEQPAPAPDAGKPTKINGHARPGGGPVIVIRTEAQNAAVLEKFFARQRKMNDERRAAAEIARPALARLCEVLRGRSGQPHHLRALLYSLWNGQPAPLIEIVALDWEIRKDLCAVLLAFGFEDARDDSNAFFYAEMKAALVKAGQFEWFLEAFEESGVAK